MSGETEDRPSGWTVDTLRVYVEAMMRNHGEEHARLRENIDQAEHDVSRRLGGMNEVRAQLDRQAGTFFTRDAGDRLQAVLSDRISDLSARVDQGDGASRGLNAGWGYLVGGVGIISGIATVLYAVATHH